MNRAGRLPRFSSASWMPCECSAIAPMQSVAQLSYFASSPSRFHSPYTAKYRLASIENAMSGRSAGGCQFSHSAWLGAGGSVSATWRKPGNRSSMGALVHMLSAHQRMRSGKWVNEAP